MGLTDVLMMFCGIGLLLYGMKMLSSGLEVIAGNSLQGILKKATSNRFLAVFVGIVATIVVNSSTASTIMTVGFVDSGLLSLTQAIGIIMGANVGTTFSAQVIALLGGDGLALRDIAATFVGVGAIMYVFFKSPKVKNIGFAALGFGILFLGVATMSSAARPLRAYTGFQDFLIGFENPLLALLAGFIITAIIQSSTATTAILITLLASGVVIPFRTTAFILLGVNIGTSLTTVIASIPANRDSKRAATFHITYDIIGSLVFGSLILVFPGILIWFTEAWSEPAQQAAMFHTLYNVSTMLLLLPFIKYIANLMEKIVPDNIKPAEAMYEQKLMYIDAKALRVPTVAIVNARLEICRMGKIANENLKLALESLLENDLSKANRVIDNEKTIDFLHQNIAEKLAETTNMRLSTRDAKKVGIMYVVVSDIEQIGDHAENIAEYVLTLRENGIVFTDEAIDELQKISALTMELMVKAFDSYEKQDTTQIEDIKEHEDTIYGLTSEFAENHFRRLGEKICRPKSGVVFTDILKDLEGCADHAEKIALTTLEQS